MEKQKPTTKATEKVWAKPRKRLIVLLPTFKKPKPAQLIGPVRPKIFLGGLNHNRNSATLNAGGLEQDGAPVEIQE